MLIKINWHNRVLSAWNAVRTLHPFVTIIIRVIFILRPQILSAFLFFSKDSSLLPDDADGTIEAQRRDGIFPK